MKPHAEILTVGSLAFDSIRSPAGEAERILGGSGNYFSLAASFFAKIQLVGIVGNDFPSDHLKHLGTRGIDTAGVQIVKDGKTFHWAGEYNENLNEAKTLSTSLNVFEHFNPKLTTAQKSVPNLFLANIDPILQESLLDQATDPRWVACDTMNFWISGKRAELDRVLKRVDLLSINEGEAYLLSKKKTLIQAARAIQAMGPRVVVIKRGEYGASLFVDQDIFLAPAYPVDHVIDPTGAGDSFAGAMMGYLAEAGVDRKLLKEDPKKFFSLIKRAVIAGCAMASFTVEDFGLGRLMKITKDEVVHRQSRLLEMVTL